MNLRLFSRLHAALATLLCPLFFSACETGMQMSHTTPAQLSVSLASHRSPSLHSGNHFAYWIWKDDDGTWHVRTTSARVPHRFQGIIRPSLAGSIQALKGVGLENPGRRGRGGDRLEFVGGDVVFDFSTKDTEDGLDFQLVGNPCLEFDLRIDGDEDPGKIYVGKNQSKPGKAHFILCP
jgi:hypothetical protein